jgi:hypothetical protein
MFGGGSAHVCGYLHRLHAVMVMISGAFQTLNEHLTNSCAEISDELNIFRTGFYEPYSEEISVLIFKILLLEAEIEEFLKRTELMQKEPKID